MYVFALTKFLSMSIPYILISPLVFLISDVIIPIVVDLPAPLGPRRAKKSPC
jgi:hypothetical protein